jgi:hypothetical protein
MRLRRGVVELSASMVVSSYNRMEMGKEKGSETWDGEMWLGAGKNLELQIPVSILGLQK